MVPYPSISSFFIYTVPVKNAFPVCTGEVCAVTKQVISDNPAGNFLNAR